MEPITTIASTAVKIATSEISKGAVKELAKNSIISLKPSVLKGDIVSPIKSREITNFIKTKQYSQPKIELTQGFNKGVERINTINGNLNGGIHKETGIKFHTKDVINGDGKIVKGVFPDFSKVSVHNTTLPKNLIKAPGKLDIVKQNVYCTSTLKQEFIKNPEKILKRFEESNKQLIKDGANKLHGKELNMKQILEKQTNDILNPTRAEAGNVYGFSWHHHEKMGKMQLVPNGIHDKVRHTGGKSIWC